MKPKEYFDKFPETPVGIFPYDSQITQLAEEYRAKLQALLGELEVDIQHYGSAALKIAGKKELEFALYPHKEKDWGEALIILEKEYGVPVTKKEMRVRFGDEYKGVPVEIDIKKGAAAAEAKETMRLLSLPKIRDEYEALKLKSAHSMREYSYQKKKFFADLVEGSGDLG